MSVCHIYYYGNYFRRSWSQNQWNTFVASILFGIFDTFVNDIMHRLKNFASRTRICAYLEMEAHDTFLHDHSSFSGKLALFFHRLNWKYMVAPAVFLTAVMGIAALALLVVVDRKDSNTIPSPVLQVAPENSLLCADPTDDNIIEGDVVGWNVVKKSSQGIFDAEVCENGLYSFEGFDPILDVSSMKTLRLRYLVIDAPALTHSLQQWTNLETIVIENVWVNGNFSRVYLPNLKKFIFHQFRNEKTDVYKQPDIFKEILFFDMSPNETWDLYTDLLNLNMTIQLTIQATKILDIEPTEGEININTHECDNIYKYFNPATSFQLSSLSLSWCSVENATLDQLEGNADNLKFLFLNNAVPYSSEDWMKILSSLHNLKELHVFLRFKCDWPGYEIFLNVSNLAPTVETISITNLDLSFELGLPAQSVRNLSLDTYVGENIVNNFPHVFPNVSTVALFNITQNLSYPLIYQVLQVKPELLIVTNFTRILYHQPSAPLLKKIGSEKSRASKSNLKSDKLVTDTITQVEDILSKAGIPNYARSFMLELCKDSETYVGKALTSFQRHFYRYKRLAFSKIDTYADYVTWDANPK